MNSDKVCILCMFASILPIGEIEVFIKINGNSFTRSTRMGVKLSEYTGLLPYYRRYQSEYISLGLLKSKPVLQIRQVNRNNLGIIFHISPYKHKL